MESDAEVMLRQLDPWLAERCRIVRPGDVPRQGNFVLYWVRTAVRADENPALDVALAVGDRLQVPVFVYHALSERYPYASDRHHTFILEGARDLQRALHEQGIGYAFHLERKGHRDPHLKTLSARAALVVTEEMPVQPLTRWLDRLARSTPTPILAVDTACVVPMQCVGRPYERAFAFRDATKQLYGQRLHRVPAAMRPRHPPFVPDDLPFHPLDLQTASLAELVSQCDIDHMIGPVPHTPGGSTAGYARWESFKQRVIARYDHLRNDPLGDGVSRLSAYLHYGMVSPLRIAREAAAIDRPGAHKYLDELLTWRELAYSFCFYRQDHARTSALPAWARQTLAEHEDDPRPEHFSWESLARGKTGDELWDAAQQSLLIHGELHNNVRMTWGKALLNWTPDARAALAMLIELNHRYALDGRDPASYGGILWCLGQFDRPFPPARPIYGTVRQRSTRQHGQRLNVTRYRQRTVRPLSAKMPEVAVIGAGISGLTCARTLADHGLDVTVIEKSRGVGGRMATRRIDQSLQFDHGAQYFTVRDRRFRRYVASWLADGIVAPWQGRVVALEDGRPREEKRSTDRFVAVPSMNAICKHLAKDLNVQCRTRVVSLQRRGTKWSLEDERGEVSLYDAVIISAPAPQTADLLKEPAAHMANQARSVPVDGCWALMIACDVSLEVDFDGAFVHQSPLSWIARNGSKPGRERTETWVLHAAPEWSRAHLEDDPISVEAELERAFWQATGATPRSLTFRVVHRWRYALPREPLPQRCLFDNSLTLGACGDWCGGPRVEGAFLSGAAVAGRILGTLTDRSDTKPYQLQLF